MRASVCECVCVCVHSCVYVLVCVCVMHLITWSDAMINACLVDTEKYKGICALRYKGVCAVYMS